MGASGSVCAAPDAALAALPADAVAALDAAPNAPEMLRRIHAGEASCADHVAQLLDRIAAFDGRINACVEVCDRAVLLAQAAAVDAKVAAGEELRPLEGLPVVVKLNIDTEGLLTSASTAALADHRPMTNAPVWQRLADAGAICLAKTNMPELACALNGYNPLHGHAWNPHGVGHSPGGSSAGTAAALAAGFAWCGLGSDTAGSLRIPADRCGVSGLRPSRGRYPCGGVVPLGRTDTPGPMGRSVADVALLDAVLAGGGEGAPPPAALAGVKVCVPAAWVGEVAPGCRAALDAATAALAAAGAEVVDGGEAFAAFDARLGAAKQCTYPKPGGPNTSRRAMEAYLARHPALAAGGVTADSLAGNLQPANLLTGLAYTAPAAVEYAAMDEAAFAAACAGFEAERADLEAAYAAFLADSGVAFLLTPLVNCAPARQDGDAEANPDGFAAREAAVLAVKGSDDLMTKYFPYKALYMPGVSNVGSKMLDLAVPSLATRTPAAHEVGDLRFPAGVVLWGGVRGDRELLAYGMALEAQFAKQAAAPAAAAAEGAAPAPTAHCTTIMYDFKDQADRDTWFNNFVDPDAADGFPETAEYPGISVCKLYKSTTLPTKIGFYEEWDSQATQSAYAKSRFASGFLQKYLGLAIVDGKGKFGKLKDGVEGCLVEQGPLVRGASAKHAAAAYCCTVTYDFKEAGDADAFLSGYSSDSDGFAVTAGAEGCHINKLMRFTNTMAESTGTRVGFYQEWESKELQLKYAAQRAESGFLTKWLDFDGTTSPPTWGKLNGAPGFEEYTMVMSSPAFDAWATG